MAARPETFAAEIRWRHLAAALADRGLSGARLGVEMAAISATDRPALSPARLVDAADIRARLKMVKSLAEIALLRQAVGLAEQGIAAIQGAIAPGISRDDLAAV